MSHKPTLQSESLVEESPYYWKNEPRVFQPPEKLNSYDPIAIDLFCGMGGLSIGLEMAGFQIALGLDIHKPSVETFRHAHPKAAVILGDISKILSLERANEDSLLARTVKEVLGNKELDLLVGGIPCQGFSLANKKRSILDRRNYLFVYFMEATRLLRPKYVLIENVTGLATFNNGSFVNDIKTALNELGYNSEHQLLTAADYGVPQIRRRIIFMGCRDGYSIFWPSPVFGSEQKPYRTVEDAISDLPPLKVGEVARKYTKNEGLVEYQKIMRCNVDELLNHAAPKHPPSVIEKIRSTEPGEPMYERYQQRIRLHWKRPSPTQVSGGIRPQFQFGHPAQARGLTVRERARIQSIPDKVEIFGGTVQGRVQTGNAVPPLLGMALGNSVYTGLFQRQFVQSLMIWADSNLRDFPWRKQSVTPYEILISEMLLRRTRAESIADAYGVLTRKYPDPISLAMANPQELKEILEPLGLFNIRTEALINLGKELSRRYLGTVPRDSLALTSIPHVGRYIANATLLFGYDVKKPIVDESVQRLLNRVFSIPEATEIHKADYLWEVVDTMMPCEDYKKFAWALVDFPALVCTSRNPKHEVCPIAILCKYHRCLSTCSPKPYIARCETGSQPQ